MNIKLKPVRLQIGHNYQVGDGRTIYKLIKATNKGYKFMSIKTNSCGKRRPMYPSKLSSHTKNFETWFWFSSNFVITEIVEYELRFCPYCLQMTNHLNNLCQKCVKRKENENL